MINGNLRERMRGKIDDSEEVKSKWLKGGYPRMVMRGNIIISKVKI